jgi:hypothetical protein
MRGTGADARRRGGGRDREPVRARAADRHAPRANQIRSASSDRRVGPLA